MSANMNSVPNNKLISFYKKNDRTIQAWLLISPILLYFGVFQALPTLAGFLMGFFDWVGIQDMPKFIGIKNYIYFFTNEMYWGSLWRAFYIGSLVMVVNLSFGFGAAFLLNVKLKGRAIYRTIWFVPAVTSTVATSQMFLLFIDPSAGVINRTLTQLGFDPIAWGYSTFWMVFWIVVYSSWRGIGHSMILWLAGLQSINPTLYEAAEIDGANSWRKFWHITLPGLKPVTIYAFVTSFIGAIQIFDAVVFISQGGPWGTTSVLAYRIFRDFYNDFNFGMAGTSAVVMTIVVGLFTMVTFKVFGERSVSY